MSEQELKPCPFCGAVARRSPYGSNFVTCSDQNCPVHWVKFHETIWNVRLSSPPEVEKQWEERLDVLRKDNKVLKEQVRGLSKDNTILKRQLKTARNK